MGRRSGNLQPIELDEEGLPSLHDATIDSNVRHRPQDRTDPTWADTFGIRLDSLPPAHRPRALQHILRQPLVPFLIDRRRYLFPDPSNEIPHIRVTASLLDSIHATPNAILTLAEAFDLTPIGIAHGQETKTFYGLLQDIHHLHKPTRQAVRASEMISIGIETYMRHCLPEAPGLSPLQRALSMVRP